MRCTLMNTYFCGPHNVPRFTKSWHVSYSCWKNNSHNVGNGQLYITTTLCGGQFRTRTILNEKCLKFEKLETNEMLKDFD